MRRKAVLLSVIAAVIAAVVVVALAGYMLRRSPAPAKGGPPRKPVIIDEEAEARAFVARMKAEFEKSRAPRGEVDEQKATAALQKLRSQMEFEQSTAAAPTPKVEAIAGGAGGQFQALIGDGFVAEGDMVQGGYRVKRIQADSVEFEKDGKTWVRNVN